MSRVWLISMPWDQLEHPPIQLAILQAVLERDGIDAEVHCLGLDFLDHCMALTAEGPPGERLGVADYDLVVELSRDVGLGDWIFTESTADNDAGYVRWLSEHPVAERDIEIARRFRALVPSFLDRWTDDAGRRGAGRGRLHHRRRPDRRLAGAGPASQGSPARRPHRLRWRQLSGSHGRGAAPRVSLGGRRRPR